MTILRIPPQRWDLFCAVVDNFGDVGVCWRLARALAVEHGIAVRLWIDDLASASRLVPGVDPASDAQRVDGVELRRWAGALPEVEPGDVVIAAFACALPDAFVEAMARRPVRPVWINLEYLSAEDWVAGCHGLPSPHPRLPLAQHFFFPGFDGQTGGLLREADYDARRQAFDAAGFREALGLPQRRAGELTVSLFCYENPALGELLDAWCAEAAPVTCLVPEGRVLASLAAWSGGALRQPGDRLVRGALTLQVLPFVPQPDYDALLWACDLNFVRGEDSFVRAQWAAKPFVWHIYVQEEDAHLAKLEAFLARYTVALPADAAQAIGGFSLAWNRGAGVAVAWPAFRAALPSLAAHAVPWASSLAKAGDLAANLVQFCKDALE